MVAIAKCESQLQQWYPDGRVVTGKVDPDDTGLFQINNRYWGGLAKELGLDYRNSIEDNIAMARIVYDRQGFTAWHARNTQCFRNYLGIAMR